MFWTVLLTRALRFPQSAAMPAASRVIVREPTITLVARPHFLEPAHVPVAWVGQASDGERLSEFAGRLCTMSQRNPAGRSTSEFLDTIRQQGHGSVLEHASYSLLLEGISRALTHELVRHRPGFAYSEVAQRHVGEGDLRFVMPPAIIGDEALERAWLAQVQDAERAHATLVDSLMTRYAWMADKIQRRRTAREAALGVLPNSIETRMLVTGNVRAWRTMLEVRASEDADLEFRRLAIAVLGVLRAEAPMCFSDFEVYLAADRREAARATYRKV